MAGFGKKNARTVELREAMVRAAAELYAMEIDSRQLSTKDQTEQVAELVLSSLGLKPSRVEYISVVAGVRRLLSNRDFIRPIVSRWMNGRTVITAAEMEAAGQILVSTGRDAVLPRLGEQEGETSQTSQTSQARETQTG